MSEPAKPLGRLISSHSTAPKYLQRGAVVAILSFIFFLAMLGAFYVRQQPGYFLLSTVFLVLYLFTLIGWLMQRRNVVHVYEHGLKYKKFSALWDEIRSVTANSDGLQLAKDKRDKILIPPTVTGFEKVLRAVKRGVEGGS